MENNDIIKSQLKAVDEMFNINYITAENALFERTPGGFLAMRYKDEYYPRIQPYRAFPFTDSDRFISIRTNNGNENKEIGMIEELKSLPEEYRMIADEEGKERAVCDYISGMSDRFAVRSFEELFVPKSWSVG